jgi:hypothetical protein
MPHNAFTSEPVARVVSLAHAKPDRDGWRARCPAHDGKSDTSLSIAQGDDGRVLLKCHAGCTHKAIASALGLTESDLFPPRESAPPPRPRPTAPPREFDTAREAAEAYRATLGTESARWTYRDAAGDPIGLVLRWDHADGSKKIRPAWRSGERWRLSYPDTRPLYGLDRLADAPEARVFVAEGEKCVEMLSTLGLPATTSPGGSNAAAKADWSPLAGREVAVLPDADEPGRKYAEAVRERLAALDPPARVAVVNLPGLEAGEDAVEFVGRVHGGDLGSARRAIEELAERAMAQARERRQRMTLAEVLADPGLLTRPDTVPSGWAPWDDAQPFAAVERGTVSIITAPPGCFKTATMSRMGRGFAEGGYRVAWLAGEMNPRTLVRRTICQVAGLGQAALVSAAMPPDHERKLAAARKRLDAIGDRIRFTAAPIGFEAIDEAAEWADVVFIDYLQLVRHPNPEVRGHERIEDTMAHITAAAQRTGAVFVVASAQGREGGGERRALHNATRGSSSIEYSADAIYCAEEPTDEERDNPLGFEVVFRCLKQREGEQRKFVVPIDGRTGLVTEEVRL